MRFTGGWMCIGDRKAVSAWDIRAGKCPIASSPVIWRSSAGGWLDSMKFPSQAGIRRRVGSVKVCPDRTGTGFRARSLVVAAGVLAGWSLAGNRSRELYRPAVQFGGLGMECLPWGALPATAAAL